MAHEIPGIEGASIKQLFQSISSIKIYQQGFNDGVDAVSKSLQTQLGQKSIEAAESLGLNPSEFMLDPVNAAFLPKESGQVGPRPAAAPPPAPKPSPHELARIENERRAALLREKQLKAELAAIEEERRLSKEKLGELNGSLESFKPPIAQPLASPEIPLASQVARNGKAAAKIDKQVDSQVDAVLKSIRERNK